MSRLVGVLVLAFTPCVAFGQPTPEHLTFEVATVKLSTGASVGPPNSDGGPGTRYPEWFGTDTTLRGLLVTAYGLVNQEGQVSGPAWIDSQKYAVEAKVAPGTTKAQFRQMLQNLLEERLQLVVHHESVSLPVYELVIAKSGSRLKESAPVPAGAQMPALRNIAKDRDGFPIVPSRGFVSSFGPGTKSHLTGRDQPISILTEILSGPNGVARTVIDKTGLTGKYDFTLSYDFQLAQPSSTAEASDPTLSIFDAVQQQLGLKLVSSKATFDRIIIDHAEKIPTPN